MGCPPGSVLRRRAAQHPERIEDLRRYFCRVLINEVNHLRGQLRATLVEDFESLAEAHQGEVGCPPAPLPVEETVSMSLACEAWLERLCARRAELMPQVPGRSEDHDRYRGVIIAIAVQVLRSVFAADVSEADSDEALRAAYPEWFAAEGATTGNLYQRLSRARADVRAVLKLVIDRDELL